MHGEPFLLRFRSSKAFLTGVVTYAIFMVRLPPALPDNALT